ALPPGGAQAPAATTAPATGGQDRAALAAAGQALIPQKGCPACPTIPGIPGANGTIGPNLGRVASRTIIADGAVPNPGADDRKRATRYRPRAKAGTAACHPRLHRRRSH